MTMRRPWMTGLVAVVALAAVPARAQPANAPANALPPGDGREIVASVCTQCHAERFFSHRANGGQPAGRFAAVIRLETC